MSTKQPRNLDRRIAPKEMIVTRTKSALQRRQLREKDRSLKSITQLLKSPPRTLSARKNSPKKKNVNNIAKKGSSKISEVKNIIADNKDYYPSKLKRKVTSRKILLKPKFQMKVIGTMNKRKRTMPQKEMKYPTLKGTKRQPHPSNNERYSVCTQNLDSDLSVADVVKWTEDTQSLDEEDWMEILTCPSPVWWEDPPDGYCEESIYTRPSSTDVVNNCVIDNETDKHDQIVLDINIRNCNKKFIQKRSNLECLLNNIKNKTAVYSNLVKPDHSMSETDVMDDDTFSDLSANDEEILKNLENINIPIENKDNCVKLTSSVEEEIIVKGLMTLNGPDHSSNCLTNKTVILSPVSNKPDVESHCPSKKSVINKDFNSSDVYGSFDDKICDTKKDIVSFDINRVFDSTSSINDNEFDDERGIWQTGGKNDDFNVETTSDTFENASNSVIKVNDDNTSIAKSTREHKNRSAESEFITVYKIMSSIKDKQTDTSKINTIRVKDINKLINPECNAKINLFFKKRKNVRSMKSKMTVILNEEKRIKIDKAIKKKRKSKTVAREGEMKYCHKCSSVFDTVECNFCKNKDDIVRKAFSCDMCPFVSKSRTNIIKHIISHKAEESYEKL